MKTVRIYCLAARCWIQGDPWWFALEYARVIAGGWR